MVDINTNIALITLNVNGLRLKDKSDHGEVKKLPNETQPVCC
jgi:hypothetical protein